MEFLAGSDLGPVSATIPWSKIIPPGCREAEEKQEEKAVQDASRCMLVFAEIIPHHTRLLERDARALGTQGVYFGNKPVERGFSSL